MDNNHKDSLYKKTQKRPNTTSYNNVSRNTQHKAVNKTASQKSKENIVNKQRKKRTPQEIEALRKKQRAETIKWRIIVGAVGIVIILLLVLLVSKIFNALFNSDIERVWAFESNGTVCYLEFQDDGYISVSKDSITFTGKYYIDKDIVNIDIKDGEEDIICGEYYYDLSGKELSLTKVSNNEKSNEIVMYETSKPRSITAFTNFLPDERFIGSWVVKDLNYTYNFSFDGYLILTIDNMSIEAAYVINNNLVEIKYIVDGETVTYSFVYSFNDDILFINNQNLYNYK